jgi:hypothetical protein
MIVRRGGTVLGNAKAACRDYRVQRIRRRKTNGGESQRKDGSVRGSRRLANLEHGRRPPPFLSSEAYTKELSSTGVSSSIEYGGPDFHQRVRCHHLRHSFVRFDSALRAILCTSPIQRVVLRQAHSVDEQQKLFHQPGQNQMMTTECVNCLNI